MNMPAVLDLLGVFVWFCAICYLIGYWRLSRSLVIAGVIFTIMGILSIAVYVPVLWLFPLGVIYLLMGWFSYLPAD